MVLPKEWQDFNVKNCKVHTNRVDPCTFEKALNQDHVHYNAHDDVDVEPDTVIGFNFDTIVETSDVDPLDLIVSLDLDLHIVKEDINIHLHLHMNRNAEETSNRMFSRLELSAGKKIVSLSPRRGSGKTSKKKQKKGVANNLVPTFRLFTRDDGGRVTTNLNTDEYSTMELCQTLALQGNSNECTEDYIACALSIPNTHSEADNGAESESSSNSTRDLELSVTSNPPSILEIQTFESFSSKLFTKVPIVIQTTLIYATRAEVSWFVDHKLVLRNTHSFTPQPHHIGKTLSVVITPYRKGYHGKSFPEAYQFENIIEELPYMPIVSPLRDEFTSGRSEQERKDTIRTMTYNILADLYVSRELEVEAVMYPHVKFECIRKTRRMPMLVAEILAYDADVICLQEVDGSIYDTYLEPVMQVMGYDGYYSNKASCQREGCGLFWSKKVFERDEALTFSLRDLFDPDDVEKAENPDTQGAQSNWDSMEGIKHLLRNHPELRQVIMEKIGQVVQIAKLKLKNPGEGQPKKMIVANTHLFYHPMADHIRAMQAYVVCQKVDEVRRCSTDTYPYPLMLCGDLNSDPLSGASQLLFTRAVQPDHHDCWKHLHEYQWEMDNNDHMAEPDHIENDGNPNRATDLKHEEEQFEDIKVSAQPAAPQLTLPGSFPELVSGCEVMPEFTNFAVDFIDTLDYILASGLSEGESFGFVPKRSARMPASKEVKQFVAMVSNECFFVMPMSLCPYLTHV